MAAATYWLVRPPDVGHDHRRDGNSEAPAPHRLGMESFRRGGKRHLRPDVMSAITAAV
jgi:hypothetical protein